jgi:hypothetical protein
VRERVVIEAADVHRRKPGGLRPGRKLRRPDELLVGVRARRQQSQDVLGADDGESIGARRAIDRGQEHVAARSHHLCERVDDGRRIRDVLEHFHARDDVVGRCMRGRVLFGGLEQVGQRDAGVERVQSRHREQVAGHVEAHDARALACHRFGEQSAAAADVEHIEPCKSGGTLDVVEPDRVQVVQRAHLALRVPPAAGGRLEARDLGRVHVRRHDPSPRPGRAVPSGLAMRRRGRAPTVHRDTAMRRPRAADDRPPRCR